MATLTRGDLILRMPLTLPSRARPPRTLMLVRRETVLMPPVCLVTTTDGVAPIAALASLVTHTIVPAVLTRIGLRRLRRLATAVAIRKAASAAATSVAAKEASVAAAVAAGAEPELAGCKWDEAAAAAKAAAAAQVAREVAADCSAPVEESEAGCSEGAAAAATAEEAAPAAPRLTMSELEDLQAEAMADDVEIEEAMRGWTAEQALAFFESGGLDRPSETLVTVQSLPPPTPLSRADAAAHAEACASLTAVCVRVGGTGPSAPSDGARSVMALLSSSMPQLHWHTVCLVHGLENPALDDEASLIQGVAVLILEAARDAPGGGGGQLIFDPKQGKLVPVAPKPSVFVPPSTEADGAVRDETEEEEVAHGKESEVARKRAEDEYLAGGCALAREVMDDDGSRCIHQCMLNGGVVIAVDHACALLGQQSRPITPHQKKAAAAAAATAAYAGDDPVKTTAKPVGSATTTHAAGVTVTRAAGQWPTPLPFAVGLAPPAPKDHASVMSWRRLMSTARGVDDSAHGVAACGLPPGGAFAVLMDKKGKVRPALSSAQPRLFSHEAMRERLERVTTTREQRKIFVECDRNLGSLRRAYELINEPFPPPVGTGGPFADFHGALRGHCNRCNGCPGYDLPRCQHEPSLMGLCVHCGCEGGAHEPMRSEADRNRDRKAEREDDIMKSFTYS